MKLIISGESNAERDWDFLKIDYSSVELPKASRRCR